MNNTISLMTEETVHDVYEIGKLSLKEAWDFDSLQDELKNPLSKYLLISTDNTVVGFIGLWTVAGEGQITNIAIHPKFRHKGLGKILIKHLIDNLNDFNCSSLTLEVRNSNIIAQNLYLSVGFTKNGIRKNFYTIYDDNNNKIGKEDAIIMWYYQNDNKDK